MRRYSPVGTPFIRVNDSTGSRVGLDNGWQHHVVKLSPCTQDQDCVTRPPCQTPTPQESNYFVISTKNKRSKIQERHHEHEQSSGIVANGLTVIVMQIPAKSKIQLKTDSIYM